MCSWLPHWIFLWCGMSPGVVRAMAHLRSHCHHKTHTKLLTLLPLVPLQLSFHKTARVVYIKGEADHITPCLQPYRGTHPTTHPEWFTQAMTLWQTGPVASPTPLTWLSYRMMRDTDWAGLSESLFPWPQWTRHGAYSSNETPDRCCINPSDLPRGGVGGFTILTSSPFPTDVTPSRVPTI